MTRRVCTLSITILTLGVVPASQEPLPQVSPPGLGAQTEARKPTHHLVGLACGFPSRTTLAEWWTVAAGIVRVRINSHLTFDRRPESGTRPNIYTDLEVTILDVFKLHPRAAGTGGTMTITHPGGTLETSDAYYVSRVNGFPPPAVGTEWILFLGWNEQLNEYWIAGLEQGAFEIVDGKVVPVESSQFGDLWRGKNAEVFADALRSI
jgi:hypothetical protein